MKRTIINILVFFVMIAFVLLCHYWTYRTAHIEGYKQAIKDEIETYDEGFDPDKLSYHDIVLNIIKELKTK